MTIVSEENLGYQWTARNIFDDGVDDWFYLVGNYWLGENGKTAEFVIKLKCSMSIKGVTIRNGKNVHYKNAGTKKFSIYLAEKQDGPWVKALTGTLEDQRQLSPIPRKYFQMTGKGEFVKFKAEAFYGSGAGLQYIDLHSNFFHNRWYEAKYALDQANCDQYTFDPANVGLGPEPLKQLDGFK